VQAATATLLATVQQLDPLYVDIRQPSDQARQLDADRAAGKLVAPPDGGFGTVKLYYGINANAANASQL
jgi:membrane fusion protein (multidrug efflux system)